jgi:hypothetical protein
MRCFPTTLLLSLALACRGDEPTAIRDGSPALDLQSKHNESHDDDSALMDRLHADARSPATRHRPQLQAQYHDDSFKSCALPRRCTVRRPTNPGSKFHQHERSKGRRTSCQPPHFARSSTPPTTWRPWPEAPAPASYIGWLPPLSTTPAVYALTMSRSSSTATLMRPPSPDSSARCAHVEPPIGGSGLPRCGARGNGRLLRRPGRRPPPPRPSA